MTDNDMNEMQCRIDKYKKLKIELGDIKTIANIVEQNKQGTLKGSIAIDNARLIGTAILDWTSQREDVYNAFMELVENHRRFVEESIEAV